MTTDLAPPAPECFAPGLLKGKRILVTGGGTGLGKAVARRYLALGAVLYICGRRAQTIEAAASELSQESETVVTGIPCDVTQPDAVAAMMDRIWADAPLDVLMNNAAGNFIARTERLSARAFGSVVNIVLNGAAHCSIEAGRRWIAGGRPGTILNVLTSSAWTGLAYTVPSAAAKAGVMAMTRSLAVEWGPHRIRVLGVVPGYFPTEAQMANLHPGRDAAELVAFVPAGRTGQHRELADMCSFLVSDAAAYVNGECVVIDGGAWLGAAGGRGGETAHMQTWNEAQWARARASVRRPHDPELALE